MKTKENRVSLICTKPDSVVKLLQSLHAHSFVVSGGEDGKVSNIRFEALSEVGQPLAAILCGVFDGDVCLSHAVDLIYDPLSEEGIKEMGEGDQKKAWDLLPTPEQGSTRLLFTGPYVGSSNSPDGSRVTRFLTKGIEVEFDVLDAMQKGMDNNDVPYSYKIVYNVFSNSMEEFRDAYAFTLVPNFTDKLVILMCDDSKQGGANVLVPKLMYAPFGVDA